MKLLTAPVSKRYGQVGCWSYVVAVGCCVVVMLWLLLAVEGACCWCLIYCVWGVVVSVWFEVGPVDGVVGYWCLFDFASVCFRSSLVVSVC